MSFPFRERANLRDRLRGQRDEILKEFREEFNQDRKLFENPNWGSSPAGFQQPTFSRNFPFDDDDDLMQGRRSGKLQAHLDKLSARHPELAEGLFGWREEAAGDKRKREREERDREREERERERVREERDSEKEGGLGAGSRLRNTVPDMHQQSDRDEDDRGPRARSAPPQPFQPQPQQPQPTVRHIPIYVEGRDEPLLPKEALDQQQKPASQSKPAAQSKPVPMAAPPCVNKPPASAPEEPVPLPMPAPEVPVPMPAPPEFSTPITVQQEEEQQQQQVQEEEKDAIHRVEVVEKEVASLEERVNAFSGTSKADKEYIYLDEMLTRNLLKLDDIDTEGRDEVRAARKNAIRSIQRCISILEAKTEPLNDSQ